MTPETLFAFLLSFIPGAILVHRLLPPVEGSENLHRGLALGLGVGWSSVAFFVGEQIAPTGFSFSVSELLALGFAALVWFWLKPQPAAPGIRPPAAPSIVYFFGAACVLAAAGFFALALLKPHGEWDAWAVWNLKARFLRGQMSLDAVDLYSLPNYYQPDYPLLLPGFIARTWVYGRTETVAVPILTAGVFTFGTIGLLYASLSVLRSRSQGALAGLILVSPPFFIRHGANQCADVPLSYYFLATLVCIALYDRARLTPARSPDPEAGTRTSQPRSRTILVLAGLAAGFAAWTKNEGLLFVTAILVAFFLRLLLRNRTKMGLADGGGLLLGMLPGLVALLLFKEKAPPSPLLHGSAFEKLSDPARHGLILWEFAGKVVEHGAGIAVVAVLLLGYVAFMGLRRREELGPVLLFNGLVLGVMMAGYYGVYAVTPYDLAWHFENSFPRVFLQLWPCFLFIFFLGVKTPEEVLRVR